MGRNGPNGDEWVVCRGPTVTEALSRLVANGVWLYRPRNGVIMAAEAMEFIIFG